MSTYERPTLDEVREALNYVDPGDRDVWVRMAMAIRSEFFDAGFDIWDAWSQGGSNYNSGAAKATWKSCKATGAHGGIGIGSLFHEAKANGWQPKRIERTAEQKAEAKRKQQQWAAERAKLEAEEQERIVRMQGVVAKAAQDIWGQLGATGRSLYLGQKGVGAHGLGFCQRALVIVTDVDAERVDIITGREAISQFYARKTEETKFLHVKPGVVAMPLCDWDGTIWNLQFLFKDKKRFMAGGRKQGCFHLFGELTPRTPLCITEGYATGASIHEATDFPVAITLDCGNLKPVAGALREALGVDHELLICGDDDVETKGNPGRTKALEVAGQVQGRVVFPVFEGSA